MVSKHRRNFLPTFIVGLLFWAILALAIIYLSPEKTFHFELFTFNLAFSYNIVLFFILLTLSLTLTIALVLGNTRRGFLLTLLIDSLLLLQLFQELNWINLLLATAIFLTLELYFSRRSTSN